MALYKLEYIYFAIPAHHIHFPIKFGPAQIQHSLIKDIHNQGAL
jgi:hypothetical protein